jgi:Flp pilus assembly protein CpaB
MAAAGCAAVAVAIALSSLAPSKPRTVQVVAAARDIPAGTTMQVDDVRWATLPASSEPTGAFTAMSDVVGHAAAGPIRSGEAITDVRLEGGGLGTGAARPPLAPPGDGLVAMPVRLADVEAASLLSAGEYVDVLAATPPSGIATAPTVSTASPTLAAVVASGVRVISAPVASAGVESSEDADGGAGGLAATTGDGALVVLATTPEQARALAQAELAARLSAVVVR